MDTGPKNYLLLSLLLKILLRRFYLKIGPSEAVIGHSGGRLEDNLGVGMLHELDVLSPKLLPVLLLFLCYFLHALGVFV